VYRDAEAWVIGDKDIGLFGGDGHWVIPMSDTQDANSVHLRGPKHHRGAGYSQKAAMVFVHAGASVAPLPA
jgi:hypothetical protein